MIQIKNKKKTVFKNLLKQKKIHLQGVVNYAGPRELCFFLHLSLIAPNFNIYSLSQGLKKCKNKNTRLGPNHVKVKIEKKQLNINIFIVIGID